MHWNSRAPISIRSMPRSFWKCGTCLSAIPCIRWFACRCPERLYRRSLSIGRPGRDAQTGHKGLRDNTHRPRAWVGVKRWRACDCAVWPQVKRCMADVPHPGFPPPGLGLKVGTRSFTFTSTLGIMPSFDSDGMRIAFLDEGEGEPILLIHGFASNKMVNWVYPGWVDLLTR